MDEDEVGEDYEYFRKEDFEAAPWSWPGFAFEVCAAIGRGCELVDGFFGGVGAMFAGMHNMKLANIQRKKDGEKFARDVMSGLNDL